MARTAPKKPTKSKSKKKPIVPPDVLEKRNHRTDIQRIFRICGFERVPGIVDKEFKFKERTGEIDDIFLFENVVVVVEYTTAKSGNVSDHLTAKKLLFDRILKYPAEFVDFLESKFPTFEAARDGFFNSEQCRVVVVYASKHPISTEHIEAQRDVIFLDYPIVMYFKAVTAAVRLSARFELFAFLGLTENEIGMTSVRTSKLAEAYDGTLLPEGHSHFPKGFKIVSFYIDPEKLLQQSFVLRRQGWRDEDDLYQRMIVTKKVNAIRKYLNENERVFVNNIIVTFPEATRLLDHQGNTVDPAGLKKTAPVKIQIPSGFNVIGLIDGQHRVFAYHEGGEFEDRIARLRSMQNLLATGIVYPTGYSQTERRKFESKLFLEINSTQANASSELKQSIGLMLKPFSSESIAKALISRLNAKGPLEHQFAIRFYETDKIKTTSIVSYGLKPLVKLSGTDSLFHIWPEPAKGNLENEKDLDLLKEYIAFCATQLNTFLGAVRACASPEQWTAEKQVKNKILSTTSINGLVICFRRLIEEGKTGGAAHYRKNLQGLDKFDFSRFKSSQYGALNRALYEDFFE